MITIGGEEYLTAREAADLLGIKVETLYAYTSRGMLRSYREGRKRRRLYRRAEVEQMREIQPTTQTTSLPRAEDWIPYT